MLLNKHNRDLGTGVIWGGIAFVGFFLLIALIRTAILIIMPDAFSVMVNVPTPTVSPKPTETPQPKLGPH